MDVKYGDNKKSQHIHDIEILQCKAIRIMNFKSKYVPSKPFLIDSKIMTFQDIIKSEHCLLVLQKINRINITIKLIETVQNS